MNKDKSVSVALDLFGKVEDRVALMDLAHAFASGGFGPRHSGWYDDRDIYDALVEAHREGKPLRMYAPVCRESVLTSGINAIIPYALEAGLSVRADIFEDTTSGYRLKDADCRRRVTVATVRHPKPETFQMVGDQLAFGHLALDTAIARGMVASVVQETKERSFTGVDLPPVSLSEGILEWLGVSEAPKP